MRKHLRGIVAIALATPCTPVQFVADRYAVPDDVKDVGTDSHNLNPKYHGKRYFYSTSSGGD